MRDERCEIHNHSVLVIHCQNSIFFHFECSKEKESCIFPFVQPWFITFSGTEIEINSGYGYNVHCNCHLGMRLEFIWCVYSK